jgi:hypothetical protein
MTQAKQLSKRRRSRTAMPALGAAGLSFLVSGASAAAGVPVSRDITLAKDDVSGVTLALCVKSAFFIVDRETARTPGGRVRLAMGGSCGGGCGGCGCSTGANYGAPTVGRDVNPHHRAIKRRAQLRSCARANAGKQTVSGLRR